MSHAGPSSFFSEDHQRCDALWAELEGADDAVVTARWKEFEGAMRRHFAMEEEVLFPAFEDATGMHGAGPTTVMRMEHAQMKGLLDQMRAAVERGDVQGALNQGDTLLMLVQQHNVKEESVLYPMADQALEPKWAVISARLAEY